MVLCSLCFDQTHYVRKRASPQFLLERALCSTDDGFQRTLDAATNKT